MRREALDGVLADVPAGEISRPTWNGMDWHGLPPMVEFGPIGPLPWEQEAMVDEMSQYAAIRGGDPFFSFDHIPNRIVHPTALAYCGLSREFWKFVGLFILALGLIALGCLL